MSDTFDHDDDALEQELMGMDNFDESDRIEDERYFSGNYCDKPTCRNPRLDHVHGTSNGVTYYCAEHKSWAEGLVIDKEPK